MSQSQKEAVMPGAWRTLAWTSLAVFMAALDTTILFIAFPSIRRSFSYVSAADLSWVLNAYTIVYAALLVPAGRIADRVGRRSVFLSGAAVFTIGSVVCGFAPGVGLIVAARVLQAAGGAMLTPSSLALVLASFPASSRSVAVSLWAAVAALAAAVGPSIGSAIIQFGGWRWAFFVNLPFGIAAFIRGRRVLADSRDPSAAENPDIAGIALLMIGIGLIALGTVKARDWGLLNALMCAAAGLAILCWFVARSRKARGAAIDLSLFASRSFRYSNVATLIFGATFSAMFLGSVLFLTNVWGYSTFQAGLGMTPGPLTVMVVAPLAGRIGGRRGHRALLVPGGLVFALGFLVRYLATSPTPHYVAEWLPAVILGGIGVGLIVPSLAAAATHSLPTHRFGVGSGVNQAIRQIGSVLGVAAIIPLVGAARGPATLQAFEIVFLLLALGGISTALISTAIDTRPNANAAESRRMPNFGK